MLARQFSGAKITRALLLSSAVSLAFYGFGALKNHSLTFSYLPWNLFLAWIPFVASLLLIRVLRTSAWASWQSLTLTVIWLLFLPNSFYMISDFIHLQDVGRVDVLFDAVMFTAFIYTSVLLGAASLLMVHRELTKRLTRARARVWVAAILFVCSFGIYIGRDLRWNSWDVLTNPAGLLFDVSDRLLHPTNYPQMFITVGSFFVLLTTMYALIWQTAAALRQSD